MERAGILLILAVCLISFVPGGAAEEPGTPWQQRREAVRLYAELGERERALAAELLRVNARLSSLQAEAEALREKLVRLETERAGRREELLAAERAASASRQRLKQWLVARYETGSLALLAVVFDASGWDEIAYRAELVARLGEYEAALFRKARRTMRAQREALENLRRTETQITSRERELARQAAQLKQAQAEHAVLLAEIRAEAGGVAASITALERHWFDTLSSLKQAFQVLHSLWTKGQLKPDRAAFTFGGLRLEISDRSLERQMRAAAGEDMPGVAIRPEGIILRHPGAGYELRGRLVPADDGATVRFVPEALLLDGTPVQPDVLAYVAHTPLFTLRLAQTGSAAVREIRHETGKLVLLLKWP
ncbi:MAG: hypothetical protein ACUVRC_04520 [Desulfotomaculales bacterium]